MAGKEGWRPRTYENLHELNQELDRFQAAHDSGTLRTTGDWSPGQILEHCSKLMRSSFDGFDAQVPWVLKLFGSIVFKPLLGRSHMKPGIKLPAKARSLLPDEEVPFEQGMGELRNQLQRIAAGEQMTHPSPVLGKMSHEQWIKLHLDHCRLHFGFIQCDTVGA
ncbi:MAG: DUF1569 domain-containing protein [Phycisphaerales bacterium]